MKDMTYGFGTVINGYSMEEALAKVTEALQKEGFGILTEIDVQATLKKKLDFDFRPYRILGVCNPPLAKGALEADPHIGLLLPCNVVLQELEPGSIQVSIADPKAMFTLVDNSEIEAIAEEAETKLRRVIAVFAPQTSTT